MCKKIRGIFLFFLCCFCFVHPAAANEIRITLDDQPVIFDTAPFIEKDRVLVPVRGILESLGYTVHWQEHTQSVLAMNEDMTISLQINSDTANVNGYDIPVDAPAKIKDSRTYVPLRFLAEYSGADVRWNGGTSTVSIYSQEISSEDMMKHSVVYIQTNKVQGSGIILSRNGIIATNYHVIKDASTAQFVFSDGSIYQGETAVIGLQPKDDIAILKINSTYLTPAAISADYQNGDAVTAIGAPNGQRNTVTTGVIKDSNEDILSTTAEIDQGSSGGGLFNSEGELIGMTSAYAEGHYFAIPIAKVMQVEREMSLPLSAMKYYTYKPSAPENLQAYYEKDGYAYISWAPVYGAEYYRIYKASAPDWDFQPLKSYTTGKNQWYWGFPYSFAISRSDQTVYLQVSAVVDGTETDLSNFVKIKAK